MKNMCNGWIVLVCLAGMACNGGGDSDDDDSGDSVDCTNRPFGVAPPRAELEGAWDAARSRFVFFGGDRGVPVDCRSQTNFTDEVWAFHTDCDNFEQLEVSAGPAARGRHAVALDATRGHMYVHGGRSREGTSGTYTLYDDLWSYDLATDAWTQVETTGGGPSARSMHGAVVVGDHLVVFGGSTSPSGLSYAPQDDVWVLDTQTRVWTEMEVAGGPSRRQFHAMAVVDDAVFVYGGGDENAFTGPFFDDLWTLIVTEWTWTQLHDGSGGAPAARIWPDLVADPGRDRLILWACWPHYDLFPAPVPLAVVPSRRSC